jgi:hypothetical protein
MANGNGLWGAELAAIFQLLSSLVWCSSTTFSAQLTACLSDVARHFKTDTTETVAFYFGIRTRKHRVFEPIDAVSTD